jgi:type I restriction enzyme S subunit
MVNQQKVRIGQFLKEREGRFSPNDEAVKNLKRLEKIDFSGSIYLTDKDSKTDMIIIEPGDLVISGINVSKGALAVYYGKEPITATIHYSSYIFDKNMVDINYFKRFIKSRSFIQALRDQVEGGIKTEIKPKHLLPLEIPLPDMNKQKDIVSFFDNIEKKIASINKNNNQQQSFIVKIRQQVLQEAMEGKLTAKWRKERPELVSGDNHVSKLLEKMKSKREQLINERKIKKEKPLPTIVADEKPFDLPKGWVWCRLGDIANGFEYGSSSKSKKEGRVPVLRMGNLQNGTIVWENLVFTDNDEEIEKYMLRPGDILFNRTNSRELVGKSALYNDSKDAIFAGYLVRFHMCGELSSHFANFVMNSNFHRSWCNKVKSDALGQSNINATKLRNYLFPLPPLAEQIIIVEKVRNSLLLLDRLEKQIEERKERSQVLMQSELREAFPQVR